MKDDKDVIMNGINPQTGKRMGKFLWMESDSERESYIEELRKKVTDGYFTSESVIGSLVDELAPAISDSVEVEPVL